MGGHEHSRLDLISQVPRGITWSMMRIYILGLSNTSELTSMVVRSLNRKDLKKDDPLRVLGEKMESALLQYLPKRRA